MGSEKGKRQEDELTDGLASIRSLFADHRLVDTDENDSINSIMHDNHQQYSHPDVSSTAMGFGIALAMPVQAPPRLTDAVYEGQQHQAPERTTKSSNQFRTLVSFHCFPTRQLTGTGATLANTCSHKAAPNVSAPDANAYGARRPRSTCQKRHKQLITDEMLKHESLNISIYSAPLVFKTKTKPFNNVLMDVISCQIAASTLYKQ
ncbi:hypothetical protein T11_12736, partial [Trichinella zimbabwensis]